MSVSLRPSGALFLHIPKTGGTWVEQTLGQIGIETEPAETVEGVTFRHSLLPMISKKHPFVFTFVRHPLRWYESWWKFQAGLWTVFEPGVWHPQRVLERCQSDDFDEFIRLVIEHEPGYVSRMYEWFIGPPGHDFVQFVGRQENLAEDLIDVLTTLGYDIDAQAIRRSVRANESQKRHGEPVWDPELRRRILELEAAGIRRFFADMPEPRLRSAREQEGRVVDADPPPGPQSLADGISHAEEPIRSGAHRRIDAAHPGVGELAEGPAESSRFEPNSTLAAVGPIGRQRVGIARRIRLRLQGR